MLLHFAWFTSIRGTNAGQMFAFQGIHFARDRSMPAKCADGGKRKTPHGGFPRDVLPQLSLARGQLAARRLTLLSASAVSFLSVAFSSSSVFCKILATSLRPSCFAHQPRVPHAARAQRQ